MLFSQSGKTAGEGGQNNSSLFCKEHPRFFYQGVILAPGKVYYPEGEMPKAALITASPLKLCSSE